MLLYVRKYTKWVGIFNAYFLLNTFLHEHNKFMKRFFFMEHAFDTKQN